jgi:Ca2+-binding EF-hand superfamily protein
MSLPASLEREYEEAFSLVDKDSDKQITVAEFESVISKMGAPEAKMWKDSGAGGSLMSYEQFKKAFLDSFVIENKKQEILEAWQVFDAEKTGKIHFEEIKLIFSQMGNQLDSNEIAELVKHLEPDKDGRCDYLKLTDRMFTLCREK